MKKIPAKYPRFQSGMTLTETVIVVALYTLLLAAVLAGVVHLYQTNSYTINQSYEIDLARRGLQNWLKDAREMAFADDGSFPVRLMEPNRVGFFSDIDNDPSAEYVEYILINKVFYRRIHNATGTPPTYNFTTPDRVETISEYIQNASNSMPVFRYFDRNGALLVNPMLAISSVRYLEAEVMVNIDPQRSPGEFVLRSGVSPRNLKDNL